MVTEIPADLNVLILHGKSKSGKTDVILKVVDLLCSAGFNITSKTNINTSPSDICCTLEKENKSIGIITRGDEIFDLRKDFDCIGYGCDLYICCCRSKGKTVEFVSRISGSGMQLWLEKFTISHNRLPDSICIDKLQNSANLCQATEIAEIVKTILTQN